MESGACQSLSVKSNKLSALPLLIAKGKYAHVTMLKDAYCKGSKYAHDTMLKDAYCNGSKYAHVAMLQDDSQHDGLGSLDMLVHCLGSTICR